MKQPPLPNLPADLTKELDPIRLEKRARIERTNERFVKIIPYATAAFFAIMALFGPDSSDTKLEHRRRMMEIKAKFNSTIEELIPDVF